MAPASRRSGIRLSGSAWAPQDCPPALRGLDPPSAPPWVLAITGATQTPLRRGSDERNAIEAPFFSELTYAEVAARLNQPLGTIKTRIRSGLHKLRQALAEDGGGDELDPR
jgi:hypothetical protein